jgi:hypothetical protein
MIYPENYEEIKDHERFHHTEKGCDMEYRPSMSDNRNWSQEYYCHTHNVLCSKTGWELGWYSGTDNRNKEKEFTCQRCGCVFLSSCAWRNFCDNCKK